MDMNAADAAAKSLHGFLFENFGEMSCAVGVGVDGLVVYAQTGKKHMHAIPEEWEGLTVTKKWIGKVRPL